MAQLKDSLITGDLRVTGTIYGNATSANKLSTARTINGTSFDGTANITTANWGTARNIYIADNSATNTGPAVSVNGSGNSTLKLPATIKASLTGNASTATTLQTTRTIWGQNFNGSANITGNLVDVGTDIKAIAGNTLINFLTSNGGALNGKFGAIGLSGNYSQTDLSTYRFDVNGNSRFTGNINIAGANNGIYFIGSKAATRMIRMFDNTGDANGNGIGISGGGLVIIGSGEYTDNLYTAMSSPSGGTETTYIGSDNSIFLEGGGQTIANRIGIQIDTSGHVLPVKAEAGNNNAQNLGSTSYKWANVYATTFHGALDGNAATATKLGTSTIGSSERGIYLNGGTPTALTWYPHSVEINSSNTNNYPWHRVATTNLGTGSWVDKDAILIIRQRFNSGKYGVIKISARANNATTSPKGSVDISAVWMIRYGFAENDIRICKKGLSGESNQIDVYVKCTSYMRAIAYFMEGSNAGWTLIASNEVSDTTTSDKKTSTEVWADITTTSGATAYDTITNATDNASSYVKKVGDTMSGTLQIVNDTQNNSATDALLYVRHRSGNDWNIKVDSTGYDYGINVVTADNAAHAITTNGYITGAKVYGAVWNDFAEYRQGENNPGRVMVENGDDSVSISTKRLQPGASICSDTYGFAIGETNECKCPIAVAGRVLAYPLEPREEYNFFIGQAVCSGPNGTVSIMTKDEVKEYPECVIGYISAVPKYEIWGSGNVKIDSRIWIKVK